MKKRDGTFLFKTAGYSLRERLGVDVRVSRCGPISDGIALWHDEQGAWVLSYDDLMAIAREAAAVRNKPVDPPASRRPD